MCKAVISSVFLQLHTYMKLAQFCNHLYLVACAISESWTIVDESNCIWPEQLIAQSDLYQLHYIILKLIQSWGLQAT